MFWIPTEAETGMILVVHLIHQFVLLLFKGDFAAMSSKKKQDGDERFLRVQKDPRFWEMPERERKIKIDKRFQSMFHDERFKVKYTVDKRGRPISHTSTDDLKRFYKLSDSEEEEEETEGKKKKKKKGKEKVVKAERDVKTGGGPGRGVRAVEDEGEEVFDFNTSPPV